jgi:hypothetical protein
VAADVRESRCESEGNIFDINRNLAKDERLVAGRLGKSMRPMSQSEVQEADIVEYL